MKFVAFKNIKTIVFSEFTFISLHSMIDDCIGASCVQNLILQVYQLVRSKVEPYIQDRAFTDDIEALRVMIENNDIWNTVSQYIDHDPLWDKF